MLSMLPGLLSWGPPQLELPRLTEWLLLALNSKQSLPSPGRNILTSYSKVFKQKCQAWHQILGSPLPLV